MRNRLYCALLFISVHFAAFGCGDTGMTTPSPVLPSLALQSFEDTPAVSAAQASRTATVGFSNAGPNGAPVTTYSESGFTVATTLGSWTANTVHGNPAPFIQFQSAAGVSTTGEISVTSGDSGPFKFSHVDFYSSTTTIPYVITGIMRGHALFTMSGTLGRTFGNFVRVFSSNNVAIDTLVIRLTNQAAPCCSNPMGLDNLALRP